MSRVCMVLPHTRQRALPVLLWFKVQGELLLASCARTLSVAAGATRMYEGSAVQLKLKLALVLLVAVLLLLL